MKKKHCSSDGILSAALLAGVGLGAVGTFAMGWVWGGEAFAHVKILDVLIAVGTCGSAIGAVWIAIRAKVDTTRDRKIRAIIYVWKTHPFLKELREFFYEELNSLPVESPERERLRRRLEVFVERIEALDLEALYEFDPSVCTKLIQVRNGMLALLSAHHNAFHDDGVIGASLKSMRKLVEEAQQEVYGYDGDRYLV